MNPHAHPHSAESSRAAMASLAARFHRDRGDLSRARCTGRPHEHGCHPATVQEQSRLDRHTAMLNAQAHRQLPLFGISPAEWNALMAPHVEATRTIAAGDDAGGGPTS